MNNNNALLIGLGIVVVLIIGGFLIWKMPAQPADTGAATTTPTDTTGTTGTGSDTGTVMPGAASPTVTTGTLVVASNSTAVMNGKIVPNGAQTSYWYEYGLSNALGLRTNGQETGSGFASIPTPAYITGLSANTTYYYRLVGQNNLGTVYGATLSFKTNTNPPPTGTAPTTRSSAATSVSRTTANLNGSVTPNGADTSYWFEYGITQGLGNTTSFQSAGNGTGSVNESNSVSNLQPSTKYYFRMNAQNQFGTVNGAILSFTTSGPANSSAPSADTTAPGGVTPSQATLHGTVNPNGDSTSYWFEYGKDSLLGNILGSTTHTVLAGSGTSQMSVSSDVTTLTPNTQYWYRVVAQNSHGTVRGDIVSFTTKK